MLKMSKREGFCMVGGMGATSYATNSVFQRKIVEKVKPLLEESVTAVCCKTGFLTIADLGCSSGPNALFVLHSIINVVVSAAQLSGSRIPEFNVFLNDLPHNDFNTIFNNLPSFYREIEENNGVGIRCFISGTPGSFYGRLFPPNLVHFMHSFSSLHWLSQVPKGLMGEDGKKNMVHMDKGCIYGRKGSPPEILKAYREQFAEDFCMFLRCRSKEIVDGGRMLLSIVATRDDEACPILELASIALYKLASQGRIDKKKLDGFHLNYYRPTIQQVKESIESEGSFSLHNLDTFALSWIATMKTVVQVKNGTPQDPAPIEVAGHITRSIRAIVEPLLASEFGEEIMDDVFRLVRDMVIYEIATGQEIESFIIVVSLVMGA